MRTPKAWGQPCPNPDGSSYRLMNCGNVKAISTYLTQSGPRRIVPCKDCEGTFSETRDTVFFALRTAEDKVALALKKLLVNVALCDISFVLGVTEETVSAWLRRAAHKAEELTAHLLRELPVTEVQLDARWHCIRRMPAQQADADGASPALSADGRQGVWSRDAPAGRLILAAFVGPRTFASVLQLIEMTAAVVLGVPGFFRDGFSGYLTALIAVSHPLKPCPRTGKPGRPTPPVKAPHSALVYSQGGKKMRQGRLQEVFCRVGCGAQQRETRGLSLRTSLMERLNLTLRHALAPLVRKSWCFWKDRPQMRRRMMLLQTCDNFARPAMHLRVSLPEKEPHAAELIPLTWYQRLPRRAAGMEHVWTFRALLTVKFEPLHNQSNRG